MIRFLEITNQAIFYYYFVCNLFYLTMLVIALKTSAEHQRRLQSLKLEWYKDSPLAPPITIVAPAHNEEKSIREAVRNLLDLDYPGLEIIVINDGSTDRTLAELQGEFRLRLVRAVYVPQTPSARVRGLYRSDADPRLLVVDKNAGGSKADAVNAGLNAATSPYVCVVDADSVLERDALLRIMVPVLADPKRVVSVGGIVRVLNGSRIEGGRLRRVCLPKRGIEVIQVVEYLRAFLIGRGLGASEHADDHFWGIWRISNGSGARGRRLSGACDRRGLRSRGAPASTFARQGRGLPHPIRTRSCLLDGSAFGLAIPRATAGALAERSAGRSLAKPGHAFPAALRPDRIPRASLPVAL